LGGGNVNPSFITGLDNARDLAVDSSYLYWADVTLNTIGRAALDGGGVNQNFVPNAGDGGGVAVNGAGSQSISFTTNPPSDVAVADNYAVGTTGGGSGNPVTLTIDPVSSSVCAISGSTVRFETSGTCTIDANQGASASYYAALEAQQSVTVRPALYWGATAFVNGGTVGSIGRASNDGGDLNANFITSGSSAGSVTVAGNYVYWVDFANGSIGRANLDGTNVDDAFISLNTVGITGLAVAGSYVYWAESSSSGTIGRASIDGTGVNQSFISNLAWPQGLTADGSHLYWASDFGRTIGRASLDGTGVNQSFISNLNSPTAVAVDGSFVYWTASGGIGRANLDGSSPNPSFITNADNLQGLAVDGSYIYWVNDGQSPSIGRANLDGSSPNDNLITGLTDPIGIAVNAGQ
jgi:hypothetical protein